MYGWNTILSFGMTYFQGPTVSFREGITQALAKQKQEMSVSVCLYWVFKNLCQDGKISDHHDDITLVFQIPYE